MAHLLDHLLQVKAVGAGDLAAVDLTLGALAAVRVAQALVEGEVR
jgi:hypothetical protein